MINLLFSFNVKIYFLTEYHNNITLHRVACILGSMYTQTIDLKSGFHCLRSELAQILTYVGDDSNSDLWKIGQKMGAISFGNGQGRLTKTKKRTLPLFQKCCPMQQDVFSMLMIRRQRKNMKKKDVVSLWDKMIPVHLRLHCLSVSKLSKAKESTVDFNLYDSSLLQNLNGSLQIFDFYTTSLLQTCFIAIASFFSILKHPNKSFLML